MSIETIAFELLNDHVSRINYKICYFFFPFKLINFARIFKAFILFSLRYILEKKLKEIM